MSSHAAKAFGAVMYACAFVRKQGFRIFAFLFAAAVCYSRIYLGVHYLGDVVCGSLLGMAIGVFCLIVVIKMTRQKCAPILQKLCRTTFAKYKDL